MNALARAGVYVAYGLRLVLFLCVHVCTCVSVRVNMCAVCVRCVCASLRVCFRACVCVVCVRVWQGIKIFEG